MPVKKAPKQTSASKQKKTVPTRAPRTAAAQKLRVKKREKIAIPDTSPLVIKTEEVVAQTPAGTLPRTHVVLHRVTAVFNRAMMALSIAIVGATLTLTGFFSFAEAPTGPLGENVKQVGTPVYGANAKPAHEVIGNIVSVFLGILGLIFAGFVIYAGFLWMTAPGQDEAKKAQTILQHSVVGLIITVAAYAITSFVLTKLVDVFK